jgi:hypothetical protein
MIKHRESRLIAATGLAYASHAAHAVVVTARVRVSS